MSTRSLNKVMLIGNLTRDPELRYTGNGTPVVTFGIATNKSWKGQDGEVQESAQYHNIVAWNKMAEICHKILAKGMKVYIEGELNTRSWQTDDNQTRYKTEVRVVDMMLLDSKGKSGIGGGGVSDGGASDDSGSNGSAPAGDDSPADDMADADGGDPMEDDLPF